MILDSLKQSSCYAALSPLFAKAFAFLATVSEATPIGTHPIDGDNVVAHVQEHATSPLAGRYYEAHRRYIDIQYMLRGRELIYWTPLDELHDVVMPFDEAKDAALFGLGGAGQAMPIRAGQFAVLFPDDGHIPSVAWADPEPVKKIVVKVRVT